jgi:hypothetical protein
MDIYFAVLIKCWVSIKLGVMVLLGDWRVDALNLVLSLLVGWFLLFVCYYSARLIVFRLDFG